MPTAVRTPAPTVASTPSSSSRTPSLAPWRSTGPPRLAPGPRVRVVPLPQAPSLRAGSDEPAIAAVGPGAPLPRDVRARLESSFNADLEAVRVHEGDTAARLARGYAARAFAFGNHIVLGAGQSVRNLALVAHEVAHVLQQTAIPAVQRSAEHEGTSSTSAHESEATAAAQTVAEGGAVRITEHTEGAQTQRESAGESFIESAFWGALEEYVPELVPILRNGPEGVLDWIKDKVTGAIRGLIDGALAPVRGLAGVAQWLNGQFGPFVTWMQEAAVKIANNDCKPINEAIAKIEEVASKLITPIIEKLQLVVGKISDFLNGVWQKFGVPVWEFLKSYAAWHWEQLQKLGNWIWDKTAPIRRLLTRAWTWLKNKLGIGEGPEGQDGILQWIQRKAKTAWDWVMAKIEPYKKQILTVLSVVGSIAVMLSPAGPVVLAGGAIYGVIQAVKWLRANLGKGDALVKARAYAQTVMIPQLMGAIGRMTAAVTNLAKSLSGKLGEFAAGLGQMVGAAAKSALEFLVDAAEWLAQRALELANWANDKLVALANWIRTGLERLRTFLQPLLDFFGKVGSLLVDIWGLPILLAGKLWNLIPRCIRDPFVDWIGPLILRQIEIFKELGKDDQAWQKTKADVMNIIRLVFVTKDLRGAIKATFFLILRVFNVPYELFEQVVSKAQSAWETVTAAPIKFLKNCVRTVGRGFQLYWGNLWENLLFGVEGWLFGELTEKGLQKPNSWTDPWELAGFVASVLRLSVDHVFELMEKHQIFQPPTIAKARLWFGRLSQAWNWIMEMRGKSPQEVTQSILGQAKDFGKAILEGIVSWVVGKVSTELATMAAAAAASAGLSEVLDVIRRIYLGIKAATRWMKKILDMVNMALDSVVNIAAGTIEPAAAILSGAMKKGTPAIIGFLGEQVGLGGVADKIGEIIDTLREKVDAAIVAILKKLKELIMRLVQGAKDAVAALLEWWKEKRGFKIGKFSHEVGFTGGRENAVLTVKSTPRPLEHVLAAISKGSQSATKKQALATIKGAADTIEKIKADTGGNFSDAEGKKIGVALKTIADSLQAVGLAAVPPTKLQYKSRVYGGDKVGHAMEANPLSMDPGGYSGSAPSDSSGGKLWKKVNQRSMTYVRGHLLNHHLHGSGSNNENLVPLTRSANTTMETQAESAVKNAVLGQEGGGLGDVVVVRYVVKMTGKQGSRKYIPEESELPTNINIQAWRLVEDNGKWKDDTPLFADQDIPVILGLDTPAGISHPEVDLSSASRRELDEIPGIGPVLADSIVKLRNKLGGRFQTYNDLQGADGIGDETVKELKALPFVKLHD